MNKGFAFEGDYKPLGKGEHIIKQYFVDNTPPYFSWKTFFLKLFPTILPGIKYLITILTGKESSRVVLTDRRLIYEEIEKSLYGTFHDIKCFDVNEISSIACDYAAYVEKRGFWARLFRKRDEKQFMLKWEISNPYATLLSEINLLALGIDESFSIPNSEDLIQELSGLIYQLREKKHIK